MKKARLELIETMNPGMQTFIPVNGTCLLPVMEKPLVFNSREMMGKGFITSPVTEIHINNDEEVVFTAGKSKYRLSNIETYTPNPLDDMPQMPTDGKLSDL